MVLEVLATVFFLLSVVSICLMCISITVDTFLRWRHRNGPDSHRS